MFRSKELGAWLQDAGISAPFEYDGQDLAEIEQDTVVVLTLSGGAPTSNERTIENPTVQITSRGAQFDPDSAEDLAWAIDDALLLPTSTTIGTTKVISIDRVGSPPRLLTRDAARRNVFVCNYIFTAGRTNF